MHNPFHRFHFGLIEKRPEFERQMTILYPDVGASVYPAPPVVVIININMKRSRWYKQPAMAEVDKITAGKTIKTLGNPFGSLGEGKGKEKQTVTHTLGTAS